MDLSQTVCTVRLAQLCAALALVPPSPSLSVWHYTSLSAAKVEMEIAPNWINTESMIESYVLLWEVRLRITFEENSNA